MGYINVNHQVIKNAADKVDKYVDVLKANMNSATSEVNAMTAQWSGADSHEYKIKWNSLNEKDSEHMKMVRALENYSNVLKDASEKYKKAQADAINRSLLLKL